MCAARREAALVLAVGATGTVVANDVARHQRPPRGNVRSARKPDGAGPCVHRLPGGITNNAETGQKTARRETRGLHARTDHVDPSIRSARQSFAWLFAFSRMAGARPSSRTRASAHGTVAV